MVEQLGFAMMPSCQARSSGLTCDTTSGTSGSIRHAARVVDHRRAAGRGLGRERLRRPAAGAEQRDVDALERVRRRQLDLELPPADRRSAARPSARTRAAAARSSGSAFSSRTWVIVRPTAPVAPTTATVRDSGRVSGMVRPSATGCRAPAEYTSGLRPDPGVRSADARRQRGARPERRRARPGASAATSQGDLDERPRGRRPIPVPVPDDRDATGRQVGRRSRRGRVGVSTASSGTSAVPRPAPAIAWTVPLSSERNTKFGSVARARACAPRPSACSGTSGTRSAAARR